LYASLTSFITSGRPPRARLSHRQSRSGPRLSWIRREIVGPNVFSWSDPIQMRYQSGDWRQVDSAAPSPVPVHMRIPRLYNVDVFETPAN
jgi:hypothetical protein